MLTLIGMLILLGYIIVLISSIVGAIQKAMKGNFKDAMVDFFSFIKLTSVLIFAVGVILLITTVAGWVEEMYPNYTSTIYLSLILGTIAALIVRIISDKIIDKYSRVLFR